MYERINVRYPLWVAILVSSVFFGLLHVMNPGVTVFAVVEICVGGLMFAMSKWYAGNIWFPAGIHTAWNFTQGILYGFNVSGISTPSLLKFSQVGQNVINGGIFGPESSLITSIIAILAILICVYYRR
jgi:membrane protease YdiL (CAAX protease family)